MARPRAPLGTAADLEKFRLEAERRGREEDAPRIRVVGLAFDGSMPLHEVAETAGVSRSTVQEFVDAYRRGGVAALLSRAPRGRPAVVVGMTTKAAASSHGAWRIRDAQHFAAAEGAPLSRASAYRLLRRMKERRGSWFGWTPPGERQGDFWLGWTAPVPNLEGQRAELIARFNAEEDARLEAETEEEAERSLDHALAYALDDFDTRAELIARLDVDLEAGRIADHVRVAALGVFDARAELIAHLRAEEDTRRITRSQRRAAVEVFDRITPPY